MDPVVVVGSGASGVHFALTALRKGASRRHARRGSRQAGAGQPGRFAEWPEARAGRSGGVLPRPELRIADPARTTGRSITAFRRARRTSSASAKSFAYSAEGFAPLVSFAAGGLAEAWTGGCYPFNEDDLKAFPFGYGRDRPVLWRSGAAHRTDAASRTIWRASFPLHDGIMDPLALDDHSALLLDTYRARSGYLNGKLHSFLGRARLAILSRDLGGRKACDYSGRCLWGCAVGFAVHAGGHAARMPDLARLSSITTVCTSIISASTPAARCGAVVALDAAGGSGNSPPERWRLAAGTLCSAGHFSGIHPPR